MKPGNIAGVEHHNRWIESDIAVLKEEFSAAQALLARRAINKREAYLLGKTIAEREREIDDLQAIISRHREIEA